MLVAGNVDFAGGVGEVEFGEGDADFDAVGRLPGKEGYVWLRGAVGGSRRGGSLGCHFVDVGCWMRD